MAFKAPEYARYAGERSTRPAWVPLYLLTVKRGWTTSKWVRRITWTALAGAAVMTIGFYIANSVVPGWREQVGAIGQAAGQQGWEVDETFYLSLLSMYAYGVLLPLSLAFGYELVARDIESNAMESYFARPLTPLSYLLGRTFAFTSFLLAATFLPLTLIWFADLATAPEGRFGEIGWIPVGFSWALTLTGIALALFAQAVTTVTRSAIWTNLSFVVLFVFGHALAWILFELTDVEGMLAISILQDVWVVCATALGEDLTASRDQQPPVAAAFGVLLSMIGVSFLFLLRGLRRRSMLG
jgi:ABC-type transport system involved in multi-copper enzyme maturation permease subunit